MVGLIDIAPAAETVDVLGNSVRRCARSGIAPDQSALVCVRPHLPSVTVLCDFAIGQTNVLDIDVNQSGS
jgi:hypothetical protein